MRVILTIIAITLITLSHSLSQEADKNKGCVPLTVNFTAPSSTSYFWEFGDNGTSTIADPSHIYTDAGDYTARLYSDATKTNLIGEVSIVVYPDLIIDITSDKLVGCNPERIQFDHTVTKHSDITINNVLWSFGDGASSSDDFASHTYREIGTYDVSLQLTTNYAECNKTIINENMIIIEEPISIFGIDRKSSCEIPATFTISNQSQMVPGNMYSWSFDNGETSDSYNPTNVTYEEKGTYVISLTVTSPTGCTNTHSINVSVGGPLIDLDVIDTSCVLGAILVDNNSEGNGHAWDFGQAASPRFSSNKNPTFTYDAPGVKTVNYTVSSGDCDLDTSFTILVPEKISTFNVSQKSACENPGILQLEAEYPGLGSYYWNDNLTQDNDTIDYTFVNPPRDSNYIYDKETICLSLIVKSDFGCRDTSNVEFELQLPEAFFIPDSIIGMAPLTIGFNDHSESSDSIISRKWYFDDGSELEVGGDITEVTHTFNRAGRYFVKLAIENASGCIDWSKGTWIEALVFKDDDEDDEHQFCEGLGEAPDPGNFCVGNSFRWIINGPTNFDYHINTDEGRFDHCWKRRSGTYQAKFPGSFPVSVDIEYKGFLLEKVSLSEPLVVPGTRAEINYEKNCQDIYAVSLESKSLNYNRLVWKYDNQIISEAEALDYRFSEKGQHKIYLEAHGNNSICQPHIDSVIIHVTEPVAHMSIEDKLCDNIKYQLDASASKDVHLSCGNNILWEFDEQRPRAVNDEKVDHVFMPGRQNLSLTVTDINGCTDRVTKNIHVYGNQLGFVLDSTICFPNNAFLENTSITDTSVVAWSWNIGSQQQSPSYTFTEDDLHEDKKDTIEVMLSMIDALGCVDTLIQYATKYTPMSHITIVKDEVCVGSDVEVRARDFTSDGSYLNYTWDFGDAGSGNNQQETFKYDTRGTHTIELYFEEEGSGCNGVLEKQVHVFDRPIAEFSSSVDSLEVICYPHIISFENQSYKDGPISYNWRFGDGSFSLLEDPTITFDKGTYTAVLTATSPYGCSDEITSTYELVGPSGDLIIDDKTLCEGQEIELQLLNPDDITEYNWDFGDGTVVTNENPVQHQYNSTPEGGQTTIDLVIKSSETGCEAIKSIPVRIQNITADFSSSADSLEHICFPYNISFHNNSASNSIPRYTWSFGDGSSTHNSNPNKTFGKGKFPIEMIASTSFGCTDTILKTIEVVGPSASVDIEDSSICIGEDIHMTIESFDQVSDFRWDLGDGTIIENVSDITHTYNDIENNGINYVNLQMYSNETGCTTEYNYSIRVHDIVADFTRLYGNDYCVGSIELENNSIGADGYLWDLGNGVQVEEYDIYYQYDSVKTYQIMLIASHAQTGCQDSITLDIEPSSGEQFYGFPNVFSPNGDGNNDVFNVYVEPNYNDIVNISKFEVYNRWGKIVHSTDEGLGWEGVLNGNRLNSDVYAYYIEMEIKDCKTVKKKGNVTLLR